MENPDNIIVDVNPTEDPPPKNELEVQQPQPTKDVSTAESASANVEGAVTETDIGNAAEEEKKTETTKMEPSDTTTTDDIKTNNADADDTEITDIKMAEDGEIEVKEEEQSPQVTPADAITTTTTIDDKNNDSPFEEKETSPEDDLKDDHQLSLIHISEPTRPC